VAIRRKALDEAAAALEPSFKLKFPKHRAVKRTKKDSCDVVMSQSASQSGDLTKEIRETLKEVGSPHWTISATGSSVPPDEAEVCTIDIRWVSPALHRQTRS
jgi:hypothetical protein